MSSSVESTTPAIYHIDNITKLNRNGGQSLSDSTTFEEFQSATYFSFYPFGVFHISLKLIDYVLAKKDPKQTASGNWMAYGVGSGAGVILCFALIGILYLRRRSRGAKRLTEGAL